MTTVLLASLASSDPMGQQAYEAEITAAVQQLAPGQGLGVRSVTITSMRSRDSADLRLPLSLVHQLPLAVQQVAGIRAYPRRVLVHRLDLRLPPAAREVVTVHDLAPLRYADEGALPRDAGRSLRRARAVICPSRFTADELCSEYGELPVRVVANGVGADVWESKPLSAAERLSRQLPERYVLHAGGASTRKNLAALAEAWRSVVAIEPGVELLLCGPVNERRTEVFARVPGARMLGKVPRAQLLRLLASAAVVVVPSRYEGFGLPAVEAMACGTPVVAARAGSLPEVCGDAAVLVEPDPEGLAAGLVDVLQNAGEAARLRAAGPPRARCFNWAASAAAHIEIYRTALQG